MNVLFKNITVITMDDDTGVIKNGYVVTEDKHIKYVGTDCPVGEFDRVIDGADKVLIH